MKSIVVNVPDDMHHEFKMFALSEKKSMTEILTECMREILKKQKKKQEKE